MEPGSSTGKVILETRSLTKRFGGLLAVDGVSLQVRQGEILGVIGPNGAGKSTLFGLISGFLDVTHGNVLYHDRDVTSVSPHLRAKMGMIRTFQMATTFKDMTVLENMALGYYLQSRISVVGQMFGRLSMARAAQQNRAKAFDYLASLGMESVCHSPAGVLSHGFQRFLGLGMAVAANPTILLLDEPLSGLSADEIERMLRAIAQAHASGVTILLIEHNVPAIMNLCDRIIVMNFGQKIAEGKPREIGADPKVIDVYLGAEYVA